MSGWIHAPMFDAVAGLRHAVTTRVGGVSRAPYDTLNVGLGSDDRAEHVHENRRRVAAHLGFERLVTPYQVHGSDVHAIDADERGRPRCDALITNASGVLLGVLGADCPGVLLIDESRHVLAVIHAGWRGVAGGVVAAALAAMTRRYGCRADAVHAWIGPAIGMQRYEVSDEVIAAIRGSLPDKLDMQDARVVAPTRPGHARLSLQRAIRLQLETLGVPMAQIACVDGCTFDEFDRFFSYRRDGARTGRHALVAGWLP